MRQPPLFRWQRWLRSGIATGILSVLIIFPLIPRPLLGVMPSCLFKKLTGLPCAFCGGTRSAHALLKGDLASALYFNPLSIVAVALLIILAILLIWEALRGRALTDWQALLGRVRPWMPLTMAILVLLWWGPHILTAVLKPKKELLNLQNPVAATLYRQFHKIPPP